VVFLGLLRPGLAREFDAELLAAVGDGALVGQGPGHEELADLVLEEGHEGGLQRGPVFEIALGPGPRHAMDPVEHVRGAALDQAAAGGIGPGFVDLAPEPEVREGRACTEEIGAGGEVCVELREPFAEGAFDLRPGLRVGAHEPDPPHHALAHLARRGRALLVARPGHHGRGDAPRRSDLVDIARPAQVEHPLVAPLVAKFLDQSRNECGHGIRGMDAGFGVLGFQGLEDRGGILDRRIVGSDHKGDDGDLRVLLVLTHGLGIAHDPAMGETLVAVVGAYLDRVGRELCAEDPVHVCQGSSSFVRTAHTPSRRKFGVSRIGRLRVNSVPAARPRW